MIPSHLFFSLKYRWCCAKNFFFLSWAKLILIILQKYKRAILRAKLNLLETCGPSCSSHNQKGRNVWIFGAKLLFEWSKGSNYTCTNFGLSNSELKGQRRDWSWYFNLWLQIWLSTKGPICRVSLSFFFSTEETNSFLSFFNWSGP